MLHSNLQSQREIKFPISGGLNHSCSFLVEFSSWILVFIASLLVRKPPFSSIPMIFTRPHYRWRSFNLTLEQVISSRQWYMLDLTRFYFFSLLLSSGKERSQGSQVVQRRRMRDVEQSCLRRAQPTSAKPRLMCRHMNNDEWWCSKAVSLRQFVTQQ